MENFDNLYSFEKHLWDLNLDVVETQETIDIDEEEGTNYQNDCQGATENEEAIGIDEEENVKNSIDCQDSIPKIGMIFNSESEAYSSYNQYARIAGFSVRRSHQKKIKNGHIRRRQYVCSKEGVRANHPRGPAKHPRANTRTGCMARILFKVQENGNWIVIKFVEEHNHLLANAERKINGPKKVKKEEWEAFVDMCSTEEDKTKRCNGKLAREKMKNSHTTGRMGAAPVIKQLDSPTGEVSRTQGYVATHTRRDGSFINIETRQSLEEINRLVSIESDIVERDLDK
ncbi:hypothetical protein IFM89_030482 [Coptis chinensis]|uniref:FAR1 domain-containing protein n=1 Tax=Coptis chinensis TaxID=261450 RepID=A0A835LG77_9MAGN|nr:hypothetical protein IFM89_030482 [Coptis chinensis]